MVTQDEVTKINKLIDTVEQEYNGLTQEGKLIFLTQFVTKLSDGGKLPNGWQRVNKEDLNKE